MKKLATALLLSALMATPAIAAVTDSDIQSDQDAIRKDNAALAKDKAKLHAHRAQKAQDEANGDSGAQAVDSTKIGADKAAIDEKKAEKNVDNKVLQHDSNEMNEQTTQQ